MSIELNGTSGIQFNDGSDQSTAATPYARKNLIINGDMRIAQRGTSVSSITTTGYYTVDRFAFTPSSMGTWTMSQDTDVPSGQGFASSLKLQCTTADAAPSSSDYLLLSQTLEGQNLQHLKKGNANAESLTVSFWVKAYATGTYVVELYDNDNSRSISKSFTIDAAGTWEKKTITYAGDTTGALDNDNNGSFILVFWLGAGSNYTSGTLATSWESNTTANRAVGISNLAASTSDYINITGVQLEVGDAASDFEFVPYDMELARCQRYYFYISDGRTSGYSGGGADINQQTAIFPVAMRAAPTVTLSTAAYSGDNNITSITSSNITPNSFVIATNRSTSGYWYSRFSTTASIEL